MSRMVTHQCPPVHIFAEQSVYLALHLGDAPSCVGNDSLHVDQSATMMSVLLIGLTCQTSSSVTYWCSPPNPAPFFILVSRLLRSITPVVMACLPSSRAASPTGR